MPEEARKSKSHRQINLSRGSIGLLLSEVFWGYTLTYRKRTEVKKREGRCSKAEHKIADKRRGATLGEEDEMERVAKGEKPTSLNYDQPTGINIFARVRNKLKQSA